MRHSVKRAIVIDDDHSLRHAISQILQKRGYEVHVSAQPVLCPIYLHSECTCPVEHACTHVLITDLNMPSMSGVDFVRQQKQNGCKVQNIAVMSALWSEKELDLLKDYDCKILTKPFKMNELSDWLDECENGPGFSRRLSDLS